MKVPLNSNQSINHVWVACPRLYSVAQMVRSEPLTCWLQVPPPNQYHYAVSSLRILVFSCMWHPRWFHCCSLLVYWLLGFDSLVVIESCMQVSLMSVSLSSMILYQCKLASKQLDSVMHWSFLPMILQLVSGWEPRTWMSLPPDRLYGWQMTVCTLALAGVKECCC